MSAHTSKELPQARSYAARGGLIRAGSELPRSIEKVEHVPQEREWKVAFRREVQHGGLFEVPAIAWFREVRRSDDHPDVSLPDEQAHLRVEDSVPRHSDRTEAPAKTARSCNVRTVHQHARVKLRELLLPLDEVGALVL